MFSIISAVKWFEEEVKIGPIKISPEDVEKWIDKILGIVIVIVLMYLVIKIGNKIIDKVVKKQIKSNYRFSLDPQKARTLGEVIKSILKYVTYIFGIGIIATKIFSTVSVAVAGLGSVALGLGAQSLVKDIINGFFILFEDQYGIGDHVTLSTYEGIVESIGIRTTAVRDFNGDLHLIPNGTISEVTNHSKGSIRFLVDVDIAYEENIDNAIEVIKGICEKFEKNNEDITEPIQVLGVDSLNESSVTIRVMGKSKPLAQWNMERDLRKAIKMGLDEANIEIPYRKMKIVE